MAPRKTTTGDKTPKAKRAPAIKKSEDKVVRRPARGYHKFRSGLLNVTPKGGEKELAKQNQTSRLLMLPPEIRNDIWKLTLGGKVYHAHYEKRFETSPTESKNATALLRTCRQIYAEAALMPLTLTTFSTDYVVYAGRALRKLKAHQRKHITSLRFVCACPKVTYLLSSAHFLHGAVVLEKLVPSLEELHIQIFSAFDPSTRDMSTREATEKRVLALLKPSIQGMSITVKVEQTHEKWADYDNA